MEYLIRLKDRKKFIAGDNTTLREILHPAKGEFKVGYSLAWFMVPAGKKTLKHSLTGSEIYYILSGRGRMHIDEQVFEVEKDDTVHIPPKSVQFIENLSQTEALKAICIVDPAWRKEHEKIHE